MKGKEIEVWIATRLTPDGNPMTVTYATRAAEVNRTTLYRWTDIGEDELRPTRALRDFVDWMRGYDRANRARRTSGAPRTPDAVRI